MASHSQIRKNGQARNLISRIESFFNADADKFANDRWFHDPVADLERLLSMRLVDEALNAMASSKSNRRKVALDLGCGPGFWLAQLSKHCDTVIGIDCSERMLELARNAEPRAILKCMDFGAFLPLPDKSVDFILMSHSLEYLPSISKLGSEISRVSRTDAVICIITKNRRALVWRLWKKLADSLRTNPIPRQYWRSSLEISTQLGVKIHAVYGVYPRIPNKFNDVNDAWENKHKTFSIGVPELVSGRSLTCLSILSWHIGIIVRP